MNASANLRDVLDFVQQVYGVWTGAAADFLADRAAMDKLADELWSLEYERKKALKPLIDALSQEQDKHFEKQKELLDRYKKTTHLP